MSARPLAPVDAAVEAAIAELLAAERSAREAVSRSHAEAAALADAARECARAIAQRAERRMQRARAEYDAATQVSLAEVAASAADIETRNAPTATDRDRLLEAIAALAARLTGGPP